MATTEDESSTPLPQADLPQQPIIWADDDTTPAHVETAAEPSATPAAAEPPPHLPVTGPTVDSNAVKEILKNAETRRRVSGFGLPEATSNGAPYWATLPPDFRPPRNKQITFIRFRSEMTDAPGKGSPIVDRSGMPILRMNGQGVQLWRQIIVWPLNVADKRFAIKRGMGEAERSLEETVRQMIRAIDGVSVDWGSAGSHDTFWNEIGEKCRILLQRLYFKLHQPNEDEIVDFLVNCVEVRSASY